MYLDSVVVFPEIRWSLCNSFSICFCSFFFFASTIILKSGVIYCLAKLQYLERKPHQPTLVFTQVFYPGWIGIWKCFSRGRKARKPGEKPWEQGNKQQQTQPKYDTRAESNQGHIIGVLKQALSPLHHPYFPLAPKLMHVEGYGYTAHCTH